MSRIKSAQVMKAHDVSCPPNLLRERIVIGLTASIREDSVINRLAYLQRLIIRAIET